MQHEEPPVFFLDRTFGKYEVAKILRQEGFLVVTIHEEFGEEESKIADPVVICDCGLKSRVLLTGDQNLVYLWAKEIRDARIGVFVITNNNEGALRWGLRIVHAKRDILRELRRRQKPFTARISTEGRVTMVRIHDGVQWRAIQIGKKNPPHVNRQKKTGNE